MRAALWMLGLAAALPAFAQENQARAVADYARYELRDIQAKTEVHPKVMTKLTTELKLRLDDAIARWNAAGAEPPRAGTLALELVITDRKFVSGGKRFWAGGFAGGSHAAACAVPHSAGGAHKRCASRACGRSSHQRTQSRQDTDACDPR